MNKTSKEEQGKTLIEKAVKLWDTEYFKKPGMREMMERNLDVETVDKDDGRKIISIGSHLYAKIILTEEVNHTYIYYHFDFNRSTRGDSFNIRLYYRNNPIFNSDDISRFIKESQFADIEGIALNAENRRLAFDKNFIDSTPEFICNCMEKLIRSTQEKVCEYLNKNKRKIAKKPEESLRDEYLVPQAEALFKGYKIKGKEYKIKERRIDLLLEHKEDKSLLAIELKVGEAGYGAFGQISVYLNLLANEFKDVKIKGCIIAGEIDNTLKEAYLANENIALHEYEIDDNGNFILDPKPN